MMSIRGGIAMNRSNITVASGTDISAAWRKGDHGLMGYAGENARNCAIGKR